MKFRRSQLGNDMPRQSYAAEPMPGGHWRVVAQPSGRVVIERLTKKSADGFIRRLARAVAESTAQSVA